MKILRLAFLSSLASLGCNADEIPSLRTFMTVEFDYKLEANATITSRIDNITTTDTYEDNIFSKPLEDALLDIDTDLIATIQERIPNGGITEEKPIPDVQFNSVNSRFINMCFTESDACKWVKSRIKLSFAENRPKSAMERATLDLVREYLEDVSESNPAVYAMYVYPMIHSSTVQFDFSPVDGPMSDEDIEDFETSFYNVYNAIVNALDGDTDVSEAFFVYQDVQDSNKLSVNLKYYGKCRYCSKEELAEILNGEIESNEQTFLSNLKLQSRSTFFQRVEEVSFSVPQPLSELPPIDSSIIDGSAAVATKSIPWLLYVGAAAAVVVIFTGVYVICKDQKDLRKEEASTGNESSSFEGNHHEGDGDVENNDDAGKKNGMHSDYEVYVY
jgi:hypothetical protein